MDIELIDTVPPIETVGQRVLEQVLDGIGLDEFRFLAHHVMYGEEPTRSFHDPARLEITQKIIRLAQTFNELGIPVVATGLCPHNELKSMEECGVPRELIDTATHTVVSYPGSVYHGYLYGEKPSVDILTGFNEAYCITESVTCRFRPKDTTLLVFTDAVGCYKKMNTPDLQEKLLNSREAMQNTDAIFTTSDDFFAVMATRLAKRGHGL